MKTKEEFQKEISDLKEQIKKTKAERKKINKLNKKLQDEVDSLWAMMDEMTKSDIENWSHIMEQLQKDTVVKALMVSKNKAEA
jgi:predicted nuclease with TOPRIM domain